MIHVLIPTLYGRIGAVLSALIIVASAVGLTMHKDVYAGRPRPDFYYYYTNLSNLLVLVYFSVGAPLLYVHRRLHALIPLAEYCIAMAIALTNLVFHFMIFPQVRDQVLQSTGGYEFRLLAADNLIVHYIVPWLVILYWLLCAPGKRTIPLVGSLVWTLFPGSYLCSVLVRARRGTPLYETDSAYPYAFLDASRLGARKAVCSCLRLYVLCAALSLLVLLILKGLFAVLGSGKALILI